jgi:acyl-CoA synthetase (AMP-forming)/AMP-acid ligase II
MLARSAHEAPGRVVIEDGGHRMDCAALYRDARALASAMLEIAAPGSVISMMLPNWHEAAIVYHAATLAGMVIHPILPSMREREIAFMLDDARSAMVFVPGEFRGRDYAAMLRNVCEGLSDPPRIIAVRDNSSGQITFSDMLAARAFGDLPEVDPDAVRMIMYTSGTTGRPKGVMHSQNSIHALIRQLGAHWPIEPGDRFLVPSPISHIGGSIYTFEMPVMLGTSAVLMEQWDATAGLALMRDHSVTHMAGATPFLEQLLAAAQVAEERLPDLKLFVCGGAGVPPRLIEDAAAHFADAVVMRVYGSTEVPVITVGTIDRRDVAHSAHTDGRAGIADVRLASGDVQGGLEIVARGPQMLVGYHRADDEAAAFDLDGFFRTGDLGHFVDEDYLVISGRAKDIIIRNGENIAPKEIEDLLAAHPAVAEVAIVGLPDPKTGERACAVVVPRNGQFPELAALTVFLRSAGIASFKLPERLELWDALPKNVTGKVVKHEIRATLMAQG